MFKNERVRRPTYKELEQIILNPKLKIIVKPTKYSKSFFIENKNNFNNFNNFNNYDKINKLNKGTQKDYELQNHDLFPDMYNKIDATGSNIDKNESRTQTKIFIPKEFDIYSSFKSSSNKPSSKLSSPYPVSSSKSSSVVEERKPLFSRERESFRRLFLDDTEKRYYNMYNQSSSSSSDNPLTQQQMINRSRSHTSSSSNETKKY